MYGKDGHRDIFIFSLNMGTILGVRCMVRMDTRI